MLQTRIIQSILFIGAAACQYEPEKFIDTAYEDPAIVTPPLESDHPLDLNLPPCNPSLELEPNGLTLPVDSSVLMLPNGGSGNYRFGLSNEASAAIDAPTGTLNITGNVGEVVEVTLTDAECLGTATATIAIGDTMAIAPQTARVPPQTTVTYDLLPTVGPISCNLVQNNSGGVVNNCTYVAGESNGIDIVQMTDDGSGESQNAYVLVEDSAELRFWNESLYLPLNSQVRLQPIGGSGHLEMDSPSAIVSLSEMNLHANETGETTLTFTDTYTGQSTTLLVKVQEYTTHELGIDGEIYTKNVIRNAGDLNGDGFDEVLMGLPRASLSAYRSGLVALYKGSNLGVESEPWMVFGSEMTSKTYFGEDLLVADFDLDGFVDLGVIAQSSDIGGTNKGALLIYGGQAGDPPFDPDPSIITGKDRFDQLASATICDINGDGLLDLVLGSPYADDDSVEGEPGKNVGSINIHYGTSNGFGIEPDIQRFGRRLNTQHEWTPTYYLQMGEHLASGDLNQDGHCDIVASTAQAGPFGEERDTSDYKGMIAVFLGSATGPSLRPDKIIGVEDSDIIANLGEQIAVADLDGDGNDELFFASRRQDHMGGTNNGAVFGFDEIDFTNNTPFLNAYDADWQLYGDNNDLFGSGLTLGDYNSDGTIDLIVGAPYRSVNGTRDGGVLVFDNQTLMNAVGPIYADSAVASVGNNEQNYSHFGQKIALIQDIGSDGIGEIAALHAQYTNENSGIYDLEMLAIVESTQSLSYANYPGQGGGSYFGMNSTLIDVDGDSILDLCVGAPKAGANNEADTGQVIWFKGDASGFDSEGLFLDANSSVRSRSDEWGHTLNGESDLDGDGYKDLVIGALRDDINNSTYLETHYNSIVYESPAHSTVEKEYNTGNFFVFKGGPNGVSAEPTFAFYPHKDAEVNRLTGGLDINGDGYQDLLAGASNLGVGGGVMIFWGRPEPISGDSPQAIYSPTTLYAGNANIKLGEETAALGDLNQDGCDDFIVGAEEDSYIERREGSARIVWGWGGAGCPAQPTSTALGIGAKDAEFGRAVSGNADLNDDGIADVAIGSTDYRGTAITEGGVWLLDGALLSGLNTMPLIDFEFPNASEATYYNIADFLLAPPIVSTSEEERFGQQVQLIDDPNGGYLAIASPLGNYGAGSLTGGIQLHRYDSLNDVLEIEPTILITGAALDYRSEFGSKLKIMSKNGTPVLLIGAPLSDQAGPDVGAMLPIILNP